jgi:alpha-tubulin suppressor-like RCC1 family protein
MARRNRWLVFAEVLALVVSLAVLALLLLTVVDPAREPARRTACANNQAQIVKAILAYAQQHGETLPDTRVWTKLKLAPTITRCPSLPAPDKGGDGMLWLYIRTPPPDSYLYSHRVQGKRLDAPTLGDPARCMVTVDGQTRTRGGWSGIAYSVTDLSFRHRSQTLVASFLDGHVETAGERETAAWFAHAAPVTQPTVYTWGGNNAGQMGNGESILYTSVPLPIDGLRDVRTVIAGGSSSVALLGNGSVWAWGKVHYQVIGDGRTDAERGTPAPVAGLAGVMMLDSSYDNLIALKADGTVLTWGSNYTGQLGDGTRTNRDAFLPVRGLQTAKAVAQGDSHSVALLRDGTVWAWGDNYDGQLGEGSTWPRSPLPAPVPGIRDVVAIAAAFSATLTLKRDGTVWGWGGGIISREVHSPLRIEALSAITAIATSGSHHLALKRDGTVWAWGGNAYGPLGDGSTVARYVPEQVRGLTNVTAIAAGGSFSLALKRDGTVWAWGSNNFGQLGDGSTERQRLRPVQVRGLTHVRAISAGGMHSLAIVAP